MSLSNSWARRIGAGLYKGAFPIYRQLYSAFKRYADRAERNILVERLSAGCIAVDAGANIGIYSRFLARCVGPAGSVHSFEPSPDNFARLAAGLAKFPNVHLNQLAVSDTTGESALYVSDELNVDHRAYQTEGEPRKGITIQSIRLDDYFKPGERVDLIKMDIQGFELHALRGASRVLADNPGIMILLEFWPYGLKCAGVSAEDLLGFLREKGFRYFLVTNAGLTPGPDRWEGAVEPATYFNLFAQPATSVNQNVSDR